MAVFRSDDYRKNLARSRQDAVDWDNIDWEKENWWEQDTPKNAENFDTVTCREACITILRLTVPKGACLPGHRDCLGTLMGMGLERRAVGDIVVQSEAVYLFVKDTVAPYLVSSLDRIGKSPVKAEITETGADFSPCRSFERVTVTLASLRADAIVAAVAGCSREEAKEMVNTGLFTKNYLPLCDPEAHLAEGDVFSIRGKGRFRLLEMAGQTKKGRWKIVLQKYV